MYYASIKHWLGALGIACLLASCSTTKTVSHHKYPASRSYSARVAASQLPLYSSYSGSVDGSVKKILRDAEKYIGTPYKYGGNASSGFDCSGFTAKVFAENNFILPRRSEEQAEVGERIDVKRVQPGDLLFFATSGGARISHVGIVHSIENDGEVKFIHASTSKGVIISSLNDYYWNKNFVKARRVL